MSLSVRIISVVLLLWLPASAWAQSGFPLLDKFFTDVDGFKAEFTQIVYDENFKEIQNSSGTMALQRPDRFRWSYELPYEQLIVGDGKEIWIYDVDLDQVTVKPQGDTLGDTPAQLLSSTKPIVDEFSVRELGERMDLIWYELLPLEEEASFTGLRLGFKKETLQMMELEDALGNRTIFEYSQVKLNPTFDQTYFSFSPPEGVDVIGRE